MDSCNILVTGGTGRLGGKIVSSNSKNRVFLSPSRKELDITKKTDVTEYFKHHKIDAVIHCAAITNMAKCEEDPSFAIETNILGTANLVNASLNKNIRFIYLSTDYVYPGKSGPYSETSPTIPFTVYGWTKLGGECLVKTLKDHCIIRTSFFDPKNIPFDTAPNDSFCSKMPIDDLVEAINLLIESNFIGTINIGRERDSLYSIYKKYKSEIKPSSLDEISKGQSLKRAKDSSLDINLWKNINKS